MDRLEVLKDWPEPMWRNRIERQRAAYAKYFRLSLIAIMTLLVSSCSSILDLAPERGMRFTLSRATGLEKCGERCKVIVVASGLIENSSHKKFEHFLKSSFNGKPKGLTILMESKGGYVVAAAKLGKLLRENGAIVIVAKPGAMNRTNLKLKWHSAQCASACVYAFMGGQIRIVPAGSSLVLHRSFAEISGIGGREYNNQVLRQYIDNYAKEMGVDAEVIDFAERLQPDQYFVIEPKLIEKWNLAQQGL